MDLVSEYKFLLENIAIWSILVTGFVCYGLLLDFCFFRKKNLDWHARARAWFSSIKTMLAAIPLIGLLGTISGLLSTFVQMSRDGGVAMQEIITGGIAEAMFTTQLGLVMAVPGLLLLSLLNNQKKDWSLRLLNEIKH